MKEEGAVMPTPAKSLGNTTKHWTNAEKEKRKAAESALKHRFVRLIAPARITADAAAHQYWKDTIKRMRGITLLDNVDTDLLASYCMAKAREDELRAEYSEARETSNSVMRRTLKKHLDGGYADEDYPTKVIRACMSSESEILRLLQAQERLVIKYQSELGLTPAGRVRLAKKRAEARPATEDDDLYG